MDTETATTNCSGSGTYGERRPYNAKGRPMHMTICPTCGREFRKQGRTDRITARTPEHAAR